MCRGRGVIGGGLALALGLPRGNVGLRNATFNFNPLPIDLVLFVFLHRLGISGCVKPTFQGTALQTQQPTVQKAAFCECCNKLYQPPTPSGPYYCMVTSSKTGAIPEGFYPCTVNMSSLSSFAISFPTDAFLKTYSNNELGRCDLVENGGNTARHINKHTSSSTLWPNVMT